MIQYTVYFPTIRDIQWKVLLYESYVYDSYNGTFHLNSHIISFIRPQMFQINESDCLISGI